MEQSFVDGASFCLSIKNILFLFECVEEKLKRKFSMCFLLV